MENVTLGITTHKRVDALRKLLDQVANSDLLKTHFNLLIVNDSGTEEYRKEYDAMLANISFDIKIIHNDKNLGLPKSFVKLVQSIKTDYFLFSADDDLLIENQLLDMLDFLANKSPCILSPRWLYKDGSVGRGIFNTRMVRMDEFRLSSGHFSGIFFKTSCMKEFSPLVLEQINKSNPAALTYPAVFFHIPIILKYKNSWWFDGASIVEGDALESTLKDAEGVSYSNIESRFRQISGFDTYISKFENNGDRNELQKESRAWSIMKAINGDKEIKKRLIDLITPSYLFRLKRKIIIYFK